MIPLGSAAWLVQELLPGIRIKVPNRHSTYGRVKLKTIQLFLGKYRDFNP
jgi:hypothetical protein